MINYEELKKHVNVLLVDDDIDYIEVTGFFLKSKGYIVEIATNGEDAIKRVEEGNVHIVLIDYYMPGLTGEDVINKIREFNKEVIIIMQTGFSGQQPPAETLERLNIQNYHDKSDGVEKLLLQVMSAVRIFNQQNEILLTKYRINAIGRLVKGIAEDLKSPLMSISAGIEASNTLIENIENEVDRETMLGLKKFYENNKNYLGRIDKILSAIIVQSNSNNKDEYLTSSEVIERIELILASEMKTRGLAIEKDVLLKEDTYIHGNIGDVIFILCEFMVKLMEQLKIGDNFRFGIKEDASFWLFSIENDNIDKVKKSEVYIIKNIIAGLENVFMEEMQNKWVIGIKKI